jgi:hypothetical protein
MFLTHGGKMMYTVPYSKETLTFELPKGMTGTLVESKRVPPIEDVERAVAKALAKPINSPH